MKRFWIGVGCAGAAALTIGACGKIDQDDNTSSSSNDNDASNASDGLGIDFDVVPPRYDGDVAFSPVDASPPDGGPSPMPPCLDAGLACPLPASVCLDARWLRSYTSGVCDTDADVCDFTTKNVDCMSRDGACMKGECSLPGR